MNLVIHAHTLKNEPLSQPISARFDLRGGTIGRSDTNTLTLPDPERHISRLHAEVRFADGVFSIRNVSSANPVILNGRPIPPGESAVLGNADDIVIGSYELRVAVPSLAEADNRTVIGAAALPEKAAPASLAPPAHPAPLDTMPVPMGTDPFADLVLQQHPAEQPKAPTSPPPLDPFEDLFKGPGLETPRPVAHEAAAPPPPPSLPDAFDPFAPPPAKPAPGPEPINFFDDAAIDGSAVPAPPPSQQKPSAKQIAAFENLLGDPGPTKSSSGTSPVLGQDTQPAASGNAPLAGNPPQPPQAPTSDFDRLPEPKGAVNPPPPPMQPVAPEPAPAPPPPAPRPWYKFGSITGTPVPAKSKNKDKVADAKTPPAASPEVPAGPNSTPPLPPPRPTGILRPVHEMAETTSPAVRVTREAPFTMEPPKPMPPIPGPGGTERPAPAPAPISIPPMAPVSVPAASRPAPPPLALPPTPSATAATPGDPVSADALWNAFCEGAGVSVQLPQGPSTELMRMIGQVLHHSVEGTLKLVAVRAAAKQELRAQVTTIQSRNNNPLKFSPDAASAIQQLLQPLSRGYMVGPAAVNEVMDDLLGHAIGSMSGMRAALAGVLQRFEPGRLDGQLSEKSVMDSLLPMNRRAKLWELYLQHYQRIQGEAEEDFHELFGKAFMAAYNDELDRLDKNRRESKS